MQPSIGWGGGGGLLRLLEEEGGEGVNLAGVLGRVVQARGMVRAKALRQGAGHGQGGRGPSR